MPILFTPNSFVVGKSKRLTTASVATVLIDRSWNSRASVARVVGQKAEGGHVEGMKLPLGKLRAGGLRVGRCLTPSISRLLTTPPGTPGRIASRVGSLGGVASYVFFKRGSVSTGLSLNNSSGFIGDPH